MTELKLKDIIEEDSYNSYLVPASAGVIPGPKGDPLTWDACPRIRGGDPSIPS